MLLMFILMKFHIPM